MKIVLCIALAIFLGGPILALAGCSAAHTTADAAYTAAQLDCVQKSQTLAESKACRAKVDQKWGISDSSAPANLDASTDGDAK